MRSLKHTRGGCCQLNANHDRLHILSLAGMRTFVSARRVAAKAFHFTRHGQPRMGPRHARAVASSSMACERLRVS
eukprot:6210270-Pleurochrysis_carterae.AAC.2